MVKTRKCEHVPSLVSARPKFRRRLLRPIPAWLEMQNKASALVGEILSVVNPELSSAGRDSLRALNNDLGSVCKGEGLAAVIKI